MSKSLLNVSNKEGTDGAGGLNCIYRQRGCADERIWYLSLQLAWIV